MENSMNRKIIIAVAPVGKDIEPPSSNPLSPEEVATETIACTKAGASMVHLHVRDATGEQTESLDDFSRTLDRLLAALKDKQLPGYLKWIKVRHGQEVRLIASEDVCYFKAEDKYTVVKTREGESLIKKSIRQLSEELDPDQFWRIHRGTIINVSKIAKVHRVFGGKLLIQLKDLSETLTVSRSYAHLFTQM